jgi:hypothetical protein
MSNFIENTTIEFHNKHGVLPFPIISESEDFGILRIKMKKTEITKTPLFMLFTIDKTGSMGEHIKKDTKMNYLKQTFKNMLYYFAKQEVDIYIRVHSFNVEVDVDIETIKITSENVKELCSKIMNIQEESSTNIELALQKARKTLYEYHQSNPGHQVAHIFMTDGNATIGEMDNKKLTELVDNQFVNIFVGYGLDHNAYLMKKLSEDKNADYQFVDDMENTGLVYGESVHQLLYAALKNVEVHVKNGLIYDWETNEWSKDIEINVLVSETEKIYQIKKDVTEEDFKIEIYRRHEYDNEYYLLDEVTPVPDLIDTETDEIKEVDLTKYIFRQKVQEILYKANNLQSENLDQLKESMKETFSKMRNYMRDNNLFGDPFMKLLCDDISITYQTMGTDCGMPFTYIRHTSQGKQRSYNVTGTSCNDDELLTAKTRFNKNIPLLMTPMKDTRSYTFPDIDYNVLSRTTSNDCINSNYFINTNIVDDDLDNRDDDLDNRDDDLDNRDDDLDNRDDNLDNYIISNDNISCYSTPSILDTMRSFSQNL